VNTIAPNPRVLKLIAWVAFAAAVAGVVGCLVFYQLTGGRLVVRFISGPAVVVAWTFLSLVFVGVGVVLVHRRPEHPVGWVLLSLGVVMAVPGSLATGYTSHAVLVGRPALPAPELVAWLSSLLVNTGGTFLITLLILIFPTGRLSSGRSRLVLSAVLLGILLWAVGLTLEPGPLANYPGIDNPFGASGPLGSAGETLGRLGAALAALAWLAAQAFMVLRFRVADERERQQLKWFALGGGVAACVAAVFIAVWILSPTSPAAEPLLLLTLLSVALIPISVAIAILRHRLYDIDQLISATFVYVALTAVLAGIYSAAIRFFNAMFVAFTGENSEAALVLTTLVLAASFTPVKDWLTDKVKSRYKSDEGATTPAAVDDAEFEERIRRVVRDELGKPHTRPRDPRNDRQR
jgi:hypothetical protein